MSQRHLTSDPDQWASVSDPELLCALAQQQDAALLELHARYAPLLYALATHAQKEDPERWVQNALILVQKHAHCHARSALEARAWILVMAHRAL